MLATLVASQNWKKKEKKVPMDYGHSRAAFKKIPLKTLLFTQQDVSSRIFLGCKISPK
jgi:hypothetical protein